MGQFFMFHESKIDFAGMVLSLCCFLLTYFLTFDAKLIIDHPINETYKTNPSAYDGSNVTVYFHGYSHPNCEGAEYQGEIFGYYSSSTVGYEMMKKVKKDAYDFYGADLICGAKIEYLGDSRPSLSFYGTAMKKL